MSDPWVCCISQGNNGNRLIRYIGSHNNNNNNNNNNDDDDVDSNDNNNNKNTGLFLSRAYPNLYYTRHNYELLNTLNVYIELSHHSQIQSYSSNIGANTKPFTHYHIHSWEVADITHLLSALSRIRKRASGVWWLAHYTTTPPRHHAAISVEF